MIGVLGTMWVIGWAVKGICDATERRLEQKEELRSEIRSKVSPRVFEERLPPSAIFKEARNAKVSDSMLRSMLGEELLSNIRQTKGEPSP